MTINISWAFNKDKLHSACSTWIRLLFFFSLRAMFIFAIHCFAIVLIIFLHLHLILLLLFRFAGWLEPLLDRIARNKTTVVCPVIDVIDDTTMEYHWRDSGGVNVGGFDWNLQFNWHAVPERERKRHKVTFCLFVFFLKNETRSL